MKDGVELDLLSPSPQIAMTNMNTFIASVPMTFIAPLLSASSRFPHITYAYASQVSLSPL